MKRMTFYGEYVDCCEEEKEEAKSYLNLWKKFTLRRLKKRHPSVELIDEQVIERGPEYSGPLSEQGTIAIKLCICTELNGELE